MTDVEECADINQIDFAYPFLKGIDPIKPPSSVVIPSKYLDLMANMERQYWEIKSKHYNVIVFFKKGAFYELYDYDAVIGNREFGLKLVLESSNRGKMRLAGVPEHSFSEWARLFVFRGYKVGRVEQMKEDEETSPGAPKAKVMPRKLVEILTPGTITDPSMISDHREIFLLAVTPRVDLTHNAVVVDAFAVDLSRRIVYHCPCGSEEEVALLRRSGCSPAGSAAEADGGSSTHVKLEQLFSDATLRSVSSLLQQLHPKEVIVSKPNALSKLHVQAVHKLTEWIESDGFSVEAVGDRAAASFTLDGLAGRSAAAHLLATYVSSLRQGGDVSVLSDAIFYDAHLTAVQGAGKGELTAAAPPPPPDALPLLAWERRHDMGMVLDTNTVSNLEVVANLQDGSEKHSLQLYLNHCATHSGRRLFRAWLLRPASTARVIAARQQCVQFLIDHRLSGALGSYSQGEPSTSTGGSQSSPSVSSTPTEGGLKRRRSGSGADLDGGDVLDHFQSLAGIDFERYLSRLADMKSDAVAGIAYVDPMVRYNKDLGIILTFIQAAVDMVEWATVFAARVRGLPAAPPPLLTELLDNLTGARHSLQVIIALFDREEAERTGLLVPAKGTAPAYDAAVERLRDLEQQLHAARRKAQAEHFRGAEVTFASVGKDLFLFEVAAADAPSMTPRGLVERTRTAKSVRYVDSALAGLVEAHKEATATKSAALLAVLRQVAARICDHCPTLYEACSALSYLDCLMNLSRLALRWERWGMPRLVAEGPEGSTAAAAVFRGRALVHPLLQTGRGRPAVPNSVQLDGAAGRVLVLTGPNMAGKSTLMRTAAVNLLLAQLGGPVCGEGMELAPVDRIFTRIGARDASHKGHSTLYVELSETAELLRHATRRSLCLVDELGRGTSTHDGMAIAYATLQALQGMDGGVAPLTIFSTHYHSIALEQARRDGGVKPEPNHPHVQLGYMDFALSPHTSGSSSSDGRGGEGSPTVTFLYQLVTGVCDRSYGVEVARMAGIPERLVQEASGLSSQLAQQTALHEDLHALSSFLQC